MPADLHNHSTFSDGSVPAERLPFLAARVGLSALAISDHDSLESIRYAYAHPVQEGVRLIPAAELSAVDPDTGRRVHLLCYWPKPDCPELVAHCETMRRRRNDCCGRSIRELEALYPQFTAEQALAYAKAGGVLFKSCIMQALCELGVAQGIYGDTYKELFGSNPAGRVLHRVPYNTVEQVISVAHAAKGVLVFAHPSVYKSMELVRRLAAEGKIDGIEVDHPRNTPEDKAACAALCEEYGLIRTGGTDFHGSNAKHPNPLGTCRTEDEQVERICALAARRQAAGSPHPYG